jgi:hypothetical protein
MRLNWSRPSRRCWRSSARAAGLAALILCGDAGAAPAIDEQLVAIEGAEGSGTLPVFASHPLLARWLGVTRLVIVIHGAGRAARQAEASALSAIGDAAGRTLVVAPQFLSTEDARRQAEPADRLRWAGASWAAGEPAAGPAPVSPFSVLDSLLRSLADPGLLPDLQAITVAGQEDGAELVQRYAAVSTHLAGLEARGLTFRFVLAAPPHYLYFTAQRPVPAADCAAADRWPYGLDGAPAYLDEREPARLLAQYRARDVVYLPGPAEAAGPVSCAVAAQGPDSSARARFYLAYLAKLAGAPVHGLADFRAAGGTAPWGTGGCGGAVLLAQGDCPALAAPAEMPAFPESPPPAGPPEPGPPRPAPAPDAPAVAAPAPAVPPAPPPADPETLADPLASADPLGPLLTRPPPPAPAGPPPRR